MNTVRTTRIRWSWVAAIAATIAWAIAQGAGASHGVKHESLMESVVIAAGFITAAVAWIGTRTADRRLRIAWRLIGCGPLAWAAGDIAWVIATLSGDELPLPSIADVGYTMFPVCLASGLVILIPNSRGWKEHVRALLDGILIAGSVFVVWWVVVLERLINAPDGLSLAEKWMPVVYPVSDIVLVTLVSYAMVRMRQVERHLPLSVVLLAIALLGMSYADIMFARTTIAGTYTGANVFEVGWLACFVLIMLAADNLRRRGWMPEEDDERVVKPLAPYLPYVALGIAGVVTILSSPSGRGITFVTWAALIAALMCRQMISVHQNRLLTADLERRVRERTHELKSSEQRFRALVQRSSDAVVLLDDVGSIQYVTDSIEALVGLPPDVLVGSSVHALAPDGDARVLIEHIADATSGGEIRTVELRIGRRSNDLRMVNVTITNMLDEPAVRGIVLNMHDVSGQRELEAQLVHDAFHDTLTGLPNRALLLERLSHALTRREHGDLAILFIDMDDFKRVNDTMGHAAGDAMLVQFAERLTGCVRDSETVARLGGDEFAVLIEDLEADYAPTLVAERIVSALEQGVVIRGRKMRMRASIGIAIAHPGDDAGRLLQSADLAMYRAKVTTNGGYVSYDPSMHSDYVARVQLEEDLRRSIGDGGLQVHYQPIFDLKSGRMIGAEALVRWDHPTRGFVSPQEFIGVAEDCGLIADVGQFVLSEAIRQLAQWSQVTATEDLYVAVNVSAAELRGDNLVAFIAEHLLTAKVPAHTLVLEITESILVEDTEENLETLRKLKHLGLRIAIDDFGTGYSSLSYLHRFPADILKVDRSFVERLGGAKRDAEFVRTIVGLGRSLGLVTVGEGVETSGQWNELLAAGCTHGQGRVFSMPVASSEMQSNILEWTTLGAAVSTTG